MWLIDWIFGLLFGKDKKKNLLVSRQEILEKIDETVRKETQEAEKVVFSKIAEMKHLVKEAEEKLTKIKEADVEGEEGNTRLRKVVSSSKTVLIGKFSGMLDRIRPPATINFQQAWSYVRASRQTLAKEIIDLRKSIAYTGIILKDEMTELGSTFEEIERTLAEADSAIQKTSIGNADLLKEYIAGINSNISEMESLTAKVNDLKGEIKSLGENEKAELNAAKMLKESPQMEALNGQLGKKSEASRRKQELKGKLIEKLGTVEKPMQRFSQMVESGKHFIEKDLGDVLRLYMTNPFIAIKRDPKGTELKKILAEVKQLVENGGIVLKDEREKEKKLEALDGLLEYSFFDEIFWEMNKADAELNKADKELSAMKVYSDISMHDDNARKIGSEIHEKENQLNALSEKITIREKQLQALKTRCEDAASDFFGQNVFLKLET